MVMICFAFIDVSGVSITETLTRYGPWLFGWLAGWLLLWRLRPLPGVGSYTERPRRRPVAVIIPARDEAEALPGLLPPLLAGSRPGDELVVVDDHSGDATTTVALRNGARAEHPCHPPEGWLGKPNACWHGTRVTRAEVLAFIDADVRPPADLIDRLAAAVAAHDDEVISVQPWHRPGSAVEHLSLFCNITALMGVGRFSIVGGRIAPRTAFGPVLALSRPLYDRIGGHAHPEVRGRHTEDIAIARQAGSAQLYTGSPDIAFRMYPGGLGDLVRGWTRSLATGARSVRWWAAAGTLAWVWSLAAGWTVAWWLYLPSALQVWVLGRRAGAFSPLAAIAYPIPLVVFLWVFVRSGVAVIFARRVTWKDRAVNAR
jgi:4,4'-diaponeurosporenoate glycosyltransferase